MVLVPLSIFRQCTARSTPNLTLYVKKVWITSHVIHTLENELPLYEAHPPMCCHSCAAKRHAPKQRAGRGLQENGKHRVHENTPAYSRVAPKSTRLSKRILRKATDTASIRFIKKRFDDGFAMLQETARSRQALTNPSFAALFRRRPAQPPACFCPRRKRYDRTPKKRRS